MDDSMINSILLPSSIHLENLEQLIKNIEQQTLNIDNFEDILDNDDNNNNESLINQSYLSISSNTLPIDNAFDENFLLKSLTFNNNHNYESISIDSLSTQRDLFKQENLIEEKLPIENDQSVYNNDQDSGFTWDDQYDTQANYCITFNIDKSQEIDSKLDRTYQKSNSTYSDDDIISHAMNNINDWSMRSDTNSLEQPINSYEKIHSEFHFSPGSSTSWRDMKKSQRTITQDIDIEEIRPISPIKLYKIFQQKTHTTITSPSNVFQLYRQQNESKKSNTIIREISTSSQDQLNTDDSISIPVDSSSIGSKSKSYDNLNTPFYPVSLFSINKSLPDLSFIFQYSNELSQTHTTSLVPQKATSTIDVARTTSSPILMHQHKHDSDRPRTLKSIKRYKNSKHSTEPLGVFYNSQLKNTISTVPTLITMKLPICQTEPSLETIKSSIQYQSRANSCDIQAMLKEEKSPIPCLSIPTLITNPDSNYSPLQYVYSNKVNQREHHSEYDLPLFIEQLNQTKKSFSCSENISKHIPSSCNSTVIFNENEERLTKRTTICYDEMRRCQTDIIHIDPVLHRHTFNDSPPNEFCLHQDEDILMEKSSIDTDLHLDTPTTITSSALLNSRKIPTNEIQISILDDLLERIIDIVKRLFEIRQCEKSFFLNNENNIQLDSLLKNDFCTIIQIMLEHGRKDFKKITLWKIIEISMNQTNSSRQVPNIYHEAKSTAQNISSNWLYKFQAFIFILLNKNELINWLYYFTRQKDVLQHYYQSPDALVLASIPTTFNLFERLMTQLEKLTQLAFQLTYHISNVSLVNDDSLATSMVSMHSAKTNARNWLASMSRRTTKTLTQSIVQNNNSTETFRSNLTKKLNTLFTRTNPQQQRKTSVVTTKLPESKQQTISSEQLRRSNLSNEINNSLGMDSKQINFSNEKLHESIARNISASQGIASIFQTKIPRPSLNIDTPKSTKYHTQVKISK